MYARIDNFAVDKAVNVIVEEGIAPLFVERYYALMGTRGHARYNLENGLAGRREYDLVDTFGVKWEVKCDRKWHATGNVYVEKQALERSKADKYLYLAGVGYVIAKSALCEAFDGETALTPGGDRDASLGLLLSLERLEEISETVIVL